MRRNTRYKFLKCDDATTSEEYIEILPVDIRVHTFDVVLVVLDLKMIMIMTFIFLFICP